MKETAADVPTLPEDVLQRLDLLRDLHTPEAIAWFPPAPGWWIAAGALLASVIALCIWTARRRRSVLGQALRELAAIERCAKHHGCPRRAAVRISTLLRRYALFAYPRQEVAGLTGERWVDFLNRAAGQPLFDAATSRILLEAPYRPCAGGGSGCVLALIGAARTWLRQEPGR
ncbi:MAG: DUF4381 family protein [Gammaproteobacteria bacterium]|nr:DUF4381 family protein [Gammaproteobacteria bacterium]